MRRFIILLFAFMLPFAAFGDARLELNTGTIHAPYNQNDADQEAKLTDGGDSIWSIQLPNGNYNAYYRTTLEDVFRLVVRGVDLTQVDTAGKDRVTTTCANTAGTFQDDDGNIYTTNNCLVTFLVERTPTRNRYDVTLTVRLIQAVAATEAEAEASLLRGASIMMR